MRSNYVKSLILAMSLIAFATQTSDANTSVAFPSGSIIIPSSASYQSDCGAVSMYGVVYDVLRANKWLAANGYGAITVYYAIADSSASAWSASGKQSPNRCTPSNLHTPPAPAADPSWTDGCDLELSGAAPLATLINFSNTNVAGDTNIVTYDTSSKGYVYPTYASKDLSTATKIRYLGGPMLISSAPRPTTTYGSDTATFLKLISGALIAKDSNGDDIDFSPFTSPKPPASGACTYPNDNYVNIHRAKVGFTAMVAKSFNSTPPRLALLDTGGGGAATPPKYNIKSKANSGVTESGTTATFTLTAAHGYSVGTSVIITGVKDSGYNGTYTITGVPSANQFTVTVSSSGLSNPSGKGTVTTAPIETTSTISGGILANYLNAAGLSFDGAQGCPTGGFNVANPAICPNGGTAGQIYDALDFQDIANNKLTITDSGVPRYTMVWTPHWDTTANGTTPPNATEVTALGYMKSFLDGQTGLFAECAAITSYEGTYEGGVAKRYGATTGYGGMQLQTCVNSAGNCSGTANQFGLARNVGTAPSGNLRNCSDVTTATNAGCAYFAFPQDPFAQLADYNYQPTSGETMDWNPNSATTQMYKPGVLTLVSGVAALDRTKLPSPALMRSSGQIVTDWFTRNVKDNTPGKGNIAYLGGHNQTGSIAATKLVLQTLLQLGTSTIVVPTTTTEASRASPIATTLNSAPAIVQGSYEILSPAPPVSTVTLAADVANWVFPSQLGHMRATVASTITTTAQSFGSGTVIFDAASGIPPVVNAGCSTPFKGACRTVFTTTATSASGTVYNPPAVFFQDSNSDILGNLIAPGFTPSVANPEWKVLVEKVLAGRPDGLGGYIAQLGGVDRSTVAVIEPSTVAGTARPTMAYFGATDGMLHAVCAERVLPSCDVAGRELWAFLPRTQLPFLRLNTARIDGSPHVADVFGSFATGQAKGWHTILTFQTGSGATVGGSTPSVYALDVTDPTNVKVVWEYTTPTTLGAYELGTGLAMGNGVVNNGGTLVNLAFAETNNHGTGGVGVVVNAINMETGVPKWKFGYAYPALHNGADTAIPASGIPGGAVAVDQNTQGFSTDVVFGDLYGNFWDVNPLTGVSKYTTNKPLFQYTTDYHPIGAMPAIYAVGSTQYAAVVPGGFDDPSDTWGAVVAPAQTAVGISLATPNANATLTESSGPPYVPFAISLGTLAGKNLVGSSQILVVGGQLFITSDNADVNNATYGSGGQTGQLTTYTIGSASAPTTVLIAGGAGSVANVSNTIYTGASNQQQQMGTAASGTSPSVDAAQTPKLTRNLWLRTQ